MTSIREWYESLDEEPDVYMIEPEFDGDEYYAEIDGRVFRGSVQEIASEARKWADERGYDVELVDSSRQPPESPFELPKMKGVRASIRGLFSNRKG